MPYSTQTQQKIYNLEYEPAGNVIINEVEYTPIKKEYSEVLFTLAQNKRLQKANQKLRARVKGLEQIALKYKQLK